MNRRILQAIILIICLGFIGTAYFSLLQIYQRENKKTILHFESSKRSRGTGVKITANVFSLDPVKGELLLRLQFDPQSDLLDRDDVLVRPVTVYTNSISGRSGFSSCFRERNGAHRRYL
jgi:hypothetical protein